MNGSLRLLDCPYLKSIILQYMIYMNSEENVMTHPYFGSSKEKVAYFAVIISISSLIHPLSNQCSKQHWLDTQNRAMLLANTFWCFEVFWGSFLKGLRKWATWNYVMKSLKYLQPSRGGIFFNKKPNWRMNTDLQHWLQIASQ